MSEERLVTLETLKDGAALELFTDELQRVLDNITDINTEAKTTRRVTLTVEIKPDESREFAQVKIGTAAKLAPIKGVNTNIYIGKHAGKAVATERNPNQLTFADNVVGMKGTK